ncbi:S-layer homology domain-containing protein [Romboutsia sp. 13368]
MSNWAKDHVDALNDKGIITGYEDGTFLPKKGITRGEAVIMLSRAEKLKK